MLFLVTSEFYHVYFTVYHVIHAQHGANIDATDIDGCTALLHATRQGQQRTVSLLLDHGANCEIG